MVAFSDTIKNIRAKLAVLKTKLSSKDKRLKILHDLQQLADSRPNDMRVQIKIADTYYKLQEWDKAIATMDLVANSYIEQDFPQKAIASYKKMLMINPNLSSTNEKLAKLYEKIGQKQDAVIQYRIALQNYYSLGNQEKIIAVTKKIAELDSSLLNKRHLAEIYQAFGMMNEALQEFETVAQLYRQNKQFDELLKLYEIILPHKPTNHSLIRDVCILYLRKQQPEHAIKTIEKYKVDTDPAFNDLYEKAKLMKKALRTAKN